MIKKKVAVVLTASALAAAMATTAFAAPTVDTDLSQGNTVESQVESNDSSQPANEQTEGNFVPGQMPAMNENGEMPEGMQPPMMGEDGQMPAMNENGEMPEGMQPPMMGEDGQMPAMNESGEMPEGMQPPMMGEDGQMPANGMGPGGFPGMPGGAPGQLPFEQLREDGTISEETYQAIMTYMKENAPEKPDFSAQPVGEPQDSSAQPENGEMPEMKEGERPDLLADLLEAGVITQDEYDAMSAAMPAMGEGQMPMMDEGQMPMMDGGQVPMSDGGQMPEMENGSNPEANIAGQQSESENDTL